MPKISVGRDQDDRDKHGLKGTGIIGKHLVGENKEAHKANPIYFDLARPHVMGVFGKRGTGKCLLPDEKVITENGLEKIEDIFEKGRLEGSAQEINREEQLYSFRGPKVQSIKENFSESKNNTRAVYRKKVNENLLNIQTKSGREITVTKEHPMFSISGWLDAGNLKEGQKIGLPRQISLEFKDRKLEVPESFEKASYSNLNRRESELLSSKGGEVSELSDDSGSYHRMIEKAESKQLISVKDNSVEITEKGIQKLEDRSTHQHYRYQKSKPVKLPEEVTPDFGEFLAYLIAEGHEQKISKNNYRIIFTNQNRKLMDRFKDLTETLFDLDTKEMGDSSVYTNSVALEEFLKKNNYKTAQNSFSKEIPDFIVTGSDKTASRFLEKYFDCEANVTNQQIDLMTASRDIADQISYMLLRFGIVCRINKKKKYAANTEDQKVRTYQQVTVSGSKQLRKFKEEIGFSIDYKSEKLESITSDSNTNVDTVPCKNTLRECREKMGADRTQLVKHKQSLKAYEDGKYHPSRKKLSHITAELETHLESLEELKETLKDEKDLNILEELVEKSGVTWNELNKKLGYSRSDRKFLSYKKFQKNPEKIIRPTLELFDNSHKLEESRNDLKKLKQLSESDVFWDEIESIEKVEYEGWVYDLTVEEDHSFTAGFGGILCHNSYSMGTLAEEVQTADIADNLSTIVIDPMGIYWSMKHPNNRSVSLLDDWDIKPESFDAKVYIPEGKTDEFDSQEMPYDDTFTLNPGEFTSQEWGMAFDLEMNSERGILLERVISKLQDNMGTNYSIEDIIKAIRSFDFPKETEEGLVNRFKAAEDWGVFGEESTLEKFTQRGELSIMDISVLGELSSGWSVRSLIVGLLAKRILRQRMQARRIEEIDEMDNISKNEMPITWMFIDEAHEFLPADGETPASDPLLKWAKIGREPGVSLVLATQQPAKLHPNALSQCDMILSHRLTAKQDIDALGDIMQTYMRHSVGHYIDALPDRPGTGLILDDNSERIYPIQMRPRKSWHAGGTPDAFED